MQAKLLQIAGLVTLTVSALFVVLWALGKADHRFVRWVPFLCVGASLLILVPMLNVKNPDRD